MTQQSCDIAYNSDIMHVNNCISISGLNKGNVLFSILQYSHP